jgi:hypothetical protein
MLRNRFGTPGAHPTLSSRLPHPLDSARSAACYSPALAFVCAFMLTDRASSAVPSRISVPRWLTPRMAGRGEGRMSSS